MPIEPPQPLLIAAALREQLERLAELVTAHPDRTDYAAALNSVAGAATLLERTAPVIAAR